KFFRFISKKKKLKMLSRIIRKLWKAKINNPNLIQIYWNLIRYNGTLSFDQRADIYLENLIDENLLPQTFAKDNQTKKRITEILFRFDYENCMHCYRQETKHYMNRY
ncbi:hypothetical protein SSS_01193, partial [Sarcoptes scabiei]